ncbi:MAG: endo-1,4-beta-xylanase, partial [Lachnospiraceae bacterium]|nr:endo-1,4-beta-xylanase [Lachnospiraceae bacterium]
VNAKKEGAANLTSVTFWGMKDDVSWLTGFRKERSYPLLFGDNWEEKEAYHAVVKVPEELA